MLCFPQAAWTAGLGSGLFNMNEVGIRQARGKKSLLKNKTATF